MNKTSVHSLKLEKYISPEAKEIQKGNYVTWGKKHEIPRILIAALEKSNTHRSIVTSLAYQLSGYGFSTKIKDGTEDSVLATALDKANNKGETWDDILNKIAFDFVVFGGFAIEVNWHLNREKLVEIYHMDFSSIASGLTDDYDVVEFYYHSTDWTKEKPLTTPIKAFNEGERQEAKQLLVFKPYHPGKDYYPSPDYYSALKDIEIDSELRSYKINGLKNGFSADFLISFNDGQPSEEEREETDRRLIENLTGNENSRTFAVTYAVDTEHAPTITPIPVVDSESRYGNMEEEKVDEILKAHRITNGMLVGVKTATGFSNNADEIKTSYELFFRYVIQPKQKILEEYFSYLFSFFGYQYDLKINPALPFEIKAQGKSEQFVNQLAALPQSAQQAAIAAMTEDEIRALIGLDPKPKQITPEVQPSVVEKNNPMINE